MSDLQIVRMDGAVPSIFFPPGKVVDGGTCQFATKKCLYNCYAEKSPLVTDIYNFIIKEEIFKVCAKIVADFTDLKGDVLQWFVSGDCEKKHEDRIVQIMQFLSKAGIVQCGFTRNVSLSNKVLKLKNMNFVLTYEKMSDVPLNKSGKFGIPNYKTGRVLLYERYGERKEKIWHGGGCGGQWFELEDVKAKTIRIEESDCNYCFKNKLGCFYSLEGK